MQPTSTLDRTPPAASRQRAGAIVRYGASQRPGRLGSGVADPADARRRSSPCWRTRRCRAMKTFGLEVHHRAPTGGRTSSSSRSATPTARSSCDADGEAVIETLPPVVRRVAGDLRHGRQLGPRAAVRRAAEPRRGAVPRADRAGAGWSAPVSFLIEFLAAIPSIAYGIWGLFVLAPFLQRHVEPRLNAAFATRPGPRLAAAFDDGIDRPGRDMLAAG